MVELKPGDARPGSDLKGGARALHESVVRIAGTAQVEHARSQVAVAPGRRQVLVIFQRGRAEFVIVRICSFKEHETPGGIHKLRSAAGFSLQPGQRLARGLHAVLADIGEDLVERRRFAVGPFSG